VRTFVTLVVDHKKPIPNLSALIAQRGYTLPGVDDVNVYAEANDTDLITLPVIEMPEEVAR
jgi:hypothetical protein